MALQTISEVLGQIVEEMRRQRLEQAEVLTKEETAELLGVQPAWLQTLCDRRMIAFYKGANGRLYFRRADIDLYRLAERTASLAEDVDEYEYQSINKRYARVTDQPRRLSRSHG